MFHLFSPRTDCILVPTIHENKLKFSIVSYLIESIHLWKVNTACNNSNEEFEERSDNIKVTKYGNSRFILRRHPPFRGKFKLYFTQE